MTTVALHARVPGVARAEVRELRELGGRMVVWVDVESDAHRGALSSTSSSVIEAAARRAFHERIPFVAVIRSSGADVIEGFPTLNGWGRVAKALADCSGVVPTTIIVDGPALSGPALLLGLADHVVMTAASYAFVCGPAMVAEFTGVVLDRDELGGAATHSRSTGVASLVVADIDAAIAVTVELLAYLPDSNELEAPVRAVDDPLDRPTPEAGAVIPRTSTGSYDVRTVIKAIVDDGELLELRPRWAANVITAFATIGGMPVGVVANQPIVLAGTIDIQASQKAARFVTFCDAFNLPLVTLVDTPGFYPGKDLEWRGMIRHGAQLVFAYGRASVPRICVILRKSYGGAYIVMDSKRMGNDLCLAWPIAELAVMGAGQAAAILQRRATPDERAAFEADYSERLLNPYVAAERGYVDGVIEPSETRRVIGRALQTLIDKRERIQPRGHDNTPL
jgi:acetyl-CoA carboxylase carboxyltransferase component